MYIVRELRGVAGFLVLYGEVGFGGDIYDVGRKRIEVWMNT